MKTTSRIRAFSLVELVIVVVIIGVIAAIAVPRISRGAKGAGESALRGDLAALRNSIDLYAAEHAGTFPGFPSVDTFELQVTTYTDDAGVTNPTPNTTYIFGPYLRSIPALPVAGSAGTGIRGDTELKAAAAPGVAWVYDNVTGKITANTGTATDDSGTLYTDY